MSNIAWSWAWSGIECTLSVSRDVAEVFHQHRQKGWKTERGGQLFVNLAEPSGLVITLATCPHQRDRAGRAWLELDTERCRQEIIAANTNGLRLVGYWHTHPQSTPAISPTDVASFSRFAAHYAQELPHPIAVIVGLSQTSSGIKAWRFHNGDYEEARMVS